MGYYCGVARYDTFDVLLEEHPYGGEYTPGIDSVTTWVQNYSWVTQITDPNYR